MRKKIFFILLMALVVTASVSFAAVTLNIGSYSDPVTTGVEFTIPISITGFDKFLAGRFIVDFGKAAPTDVTVEGGALYPNGLEDYSGVELPADLAAKNGWESTKDGAVDYEVLGSKVKIYLYAPYKTASADGVLLNIKATLGTAALSDFLTLGGKVLNGNLSTLAKAASSNTYKKLNVSGATAVEDETDTDTLDETSGADIVKPIKIGATGKTPATFSLVLKYKNPISGADDIQVSIPAGTTVKLPDGSAYTGLIKPPESKKLTDLTTTQKAKLKTTWQADTNLVFFTVGNPTEKLILDKPALITMIVERDSNADAFKIYYLPEDGEPEEAGISGTTTYKGASVDVVTGGTILESVAGATTTTYTVGVLLEHMSDFVIAAALPAAAAAPAPAAVEKDSDTCFIATAAFGSIMEPGVKVLREFRDVYLLTNSMGKRFVGAYYRYSPDLAGFIGSHGTLKAATRWVLTPVVGVSYLMLKSGISWLTAGFIALLFMVMAFGGVYMIRRMR